MIRTDRERQKVEDQIRETEQLLVQNRQLLVRIGLDSAAIEQAISPTMAVLAQLQHDIDEYDKVLQGNIEPDCLENIGEMLVKFRICQHLTQRELAKRIGVDETQVSRDERQRYKGVTMERLLKVVQALGITLIVSKKDQQDTTRALASAGR